MEISETVPLLVELIFDVIGQAIPVDHGYELFSALAHFQSELHNLKRLSIQTITNTRFENRKLLLTDRSKLRIRLPVDKIPLVYPLAGHSITIGGNEVRMGIPKIDLLRPAKQLYSRIVVVKGKEQPESLLNAAQHQLQSLGIEGEVRISVGSHGLLNRKTVKVRGYTVVGFGLDVLGLGDQDSLKLQVHGIGGKRKMGCGIFVPK
ncbi:type I-MYXAN CRISPR-associated protein Cas6/Cmx6 [Cyanobacteria bacterium FACHB-63]|nr:type I-MYXAN CRISPR-associated protein Cas6/Cmx6 [Cyanobacteria bacterium FACHB-63]